MISINVFTRGSVTSLVESPTDLGSSPSHTTNGCVTLGK